MKNLLFNQFQQIINNSNDEDIAVLSKWMDGLEKKQSGEMSTYINA